MASREPEEREALGRADARVGLLPSVQRALVGATSTYGARAAVDGALIRLRAFPRPVAVIAALVVGAGLGGCGGSDEPGDRSARPTSPPTVERPKDPVWCPGAGESQPARRFDARRLLGLTEERARRLAARSGCTVRVIKRDGEDLSRTDDLRQNRMNVETERGVIVALEGVS